MNSNMDKAINNSKKDHKFPYTGGFDLNLKTRFKRQNLPSKPKFN